MTITSGVLLWTGLTIILALPVIWPVAPWVIIGAVLMVIGLVMMLFGK